MSYSKPVPRNCEVCNTINCYSIVNNKGELLGHLCGSCIKVKYGKSKEEEQLKLLI